MRNNLLFCRKGELRIFLEQRRTKLEKEVESYDADYILNVNEEDFCQYLISNYIISPLLIHSEEIYVYNQKEVDVDVSKDPMLIILDRSRQFYVKGTQIIFAIPFEGDEELFNYTPSTFSTIFPRGIIENNEIHLIYEMANHNEKELKEMHNYDLRSIEEYSRWTNENVKSFNDSLDNIVKQIVSKRKKKLLDDMNLVNSLGIPIKRRTDIPETYTIPSIQKKIKLNPPEVLKKPFKPEPTLSMEDYRNILEIINNMSLVMERSPLTFSKLKEEEIRDHFLMILNTQYEGQATGETFNYGGKTDILIRVNDKNVFIAECKFWKGEEVLIKTINQLLGYTSWRNTKTAILLFNKNKDFTSVLEKVDSTVKRHDCYKRQYNLNSNKLKNETTFSYVFHHPDDKNREIFLTVMFLIYLNKL